MLQFAGCSISPWLYVIHLHFSQDRSDWSSPSFFSTTFQNFSGISDLFSVVSTFQRHTKLCSKCSCFLVSSLNLCLICWWKIYFLLNPVFPMTIPDLISRIYMLHHMSSCYPSSWNILHFPVVLVYHILYWDGYFWVLNTLVFPKCLFHSLFQLQSVRQSCPDCTASSLACSTRSSAYFTVCFIFPPILKSPNPSRASLVRYSLYQLCRIDDKRHPCLTPFLSSHSLCLVDPVVVLTPRSMYGLSINLLSRQSIPVSFGICINFVHFTLSNVFWQSMK